MELSPRSQIRSTVVFTETDTRKPNLKHLARLLTVIRKIYPDYHPVVVCEFEAPAGSLSFKRICSIIASSSQLCSKRFWPTRRYTSGHWTARSRRGPFDIAVLRGELSSRNTTHLLQGAFDPSLHTWMPFVPYRSPSFDVSDCVTTSRSIATIDIHFPIRVDTLVTSRQHLHALLVRKSKRARAYTRILCCSVPVSLYANAVGN